MDDIVQQCSLGSLFTVQATSGSIAAGAPVIYGVTIGSEDVLYRTRVYTSTMNQILVELYQEGFTGGTPVPAGNRQLKNTTTPPAMHYSGIARGGSGVLKTSLLIVADVATGNAGATTPDDEPFILTADTNYVLVFTNQGSGAGIVNFRFTFQRARATR